MREDKTTKEKSNINTKTGKECLKLQYQGNTSNFGKKVEELDYTVTDTDKKTKFIISNTSHQKKKRRKNTTQELDSAVTKFLENPEILNPKSGKFYPTSRNFHPTPRKKFHPTIKN